MYKIYINDRPLFLCNTDQLEASLPSVEHKLVARYTGKRKSLLNYIDQMEKTQRYDAVVLHYGDDEVLRQDFASLYKLIQAAGGLVFNEAKEALLIYRLGFWDLPKGKLEKNEDIEHGALREVEEETGISDINLDTLLHTTYHTYRSAKDKRILKRTFWYLMHTHRQPLIPQTEENIELAVWKDIKAFLSQPQKVYQSILDVIRKGEIWL